MKVLFIHRSVGQNFLDEGNVRQLLQDVSFHDLNANTNVFTDEHGVQVESIISVDNGNTNPDGLAAFFARASRDTDLESALTGYDLIAFKSCYTANQFATDEALEIACTAYDGAIHDFIRAHPSIKFLIISPPPRRPLFTNKAAATRAKAFASFLSEYASQFENTRIFDLFSLLADSDGRLKTKYRRWLPVDQHPNHTGSIAAGKGFASEMTKLVPEKVFHLQPWTPQIQEAAQSLMSEIHTTAPELEMLFMGAAALGLPGKNDIDLDILCDQKDVADYTRKLFPALGAPKETGGGMATWNFKYQGFDIDAILSDPATSHVPEQRKVFEKLKASSTLLNEYRELKVACDGLLYAEYEKRKKAFFAERVLGS